MWLYSILLLSLLASSNATVQRYCALFEAPSSTGATSNMTVRAGTKDIVVLIAHISDLQDPYIKGLDLEVSHELPAFSEMMYDGAATLEEDHVCRAENPEFFDLEKVMYGEYKKPFEFVDTVVHAGDSVSLEAQVGGVYCAFAYQEEDDTGDVYCAFADQEEDDADGLKDVTYTSKHWSTSHSLTSNQALKVVAALVVIYLMNWLVFPSITLCPNPVYRYQDFHVSLLLSLWGKMLLLGSRWLFSSRDPHVYTTSYALWLSYWTVSDHLISILVILLIYRVLAAILFFAMRLGRVYEDKQSRLFDAVDASIIRFIIGFFWTYAMILSQIFMYTCTSPVVIAVYHDVTAAFVALELSLVVVFEPDVMNPTVEEPKQPIALGRSDHMEDTAPPTLLAPYVLLLWGGFDRWLSLVSRCDKEMPLGFFQDMRVAHLHLLALDKWLGRFF